jgi:2-amino-4-hydroxy-6-hydroxymethyldihydropteridine diphosphokinase
MTRVYIALGSNLGDRLDNLEKAIAMLAPAAAVVERSSIYDTDPKYVIDQPRFLNMVLAAETELDPAALLAFLKAIEAALGRIPGERFGPRPIDLDIVFFGEEIVDLPQLTIPHPRLAERAFVLRPLADIAPTLTDPDSGKTVAEMLESLEDDGGLVPVFSASNH